MTKVELTYQMPKDYIKNKLDYERPQGEWIDPNNVGANNWCSVCGVFILHYNGICNFCPNCGADMRGTRK